MARPLRFQAADAVYHIMARGDGGRDVFVNDFDREAFLDVLKRACERFGWRVHAYVLMGNHYHLLLETPQPNLVAGMKWLMGVFCSRSAHAMRLVRASSGTRFDLAA